MTRTQRLHPVIQHTDKKEQQALYEFAQCQGVLELEVNRLEQLKDYKLEYLHKKKYDIGIFTPIQLQEFNRFMQQLDNTIERQMQVVELRQRDLEQKRREWNLTRIDAKKLHKVVDKIKHQENVEQQRSEQKALDEFAQRKNSRR